ncbi:MAG: TfpX/TfpZ family type IV pilin accessory protein [Burkholderiales bacterium]
MFALASLNRFQAAGIHFTISAVVAVVVLAALLLVWYPQPYFRLAGGSNLMLILIGVDVVLGPLMTLVVFDPAKKSLKFDLAVIAALQLAALIYGLSVMAQARPAFVVFAGDRFTIVAANQIAPESYEGAKPPFDAAPMTGPLVVGARRPTDPKELERVMLLLAGGVDLPMIPRYYVPIADLREALKVKARPLAELEARSAGAKGAADAATARSGRKRESLAWVPVLGRLEAGAAMVDLDRGDVVAVLPGDPF